MTITLSVPEAAATPDTIQFKLVLDGDVNYHEQQFDETKIKKLKLVCYIDSGRN